MSDIREVCKYLPLKDDFRSISQITVSHLQAESRI